VAENFKLPFFQKFWNNYIWTVTPLLHTKAQVLTPEAWANEAANSLDSTTEQAITIPAVLRAFQLLSETVASLPIQIHEKSKNGDRTLNTTHKLNKILGSEPNKHMSSFLWRKVIVTDMLMYGNGISRIVRNQLGDVVALRTLDADSTEIKYDKKSDTYLFDYKEKAGYPEKTAVYDEDEVLNLPWFTRDGVNGFAPIELAQPMTRDLLDFL
jgi:HK97 family phage portal protein